MSYQNIVVRSQISQSLESQIAFSYHYCISAPVIKIWNGDNLTLFLRDQREYPKLTQIRLSMVRVFLIGLRSGLLAFAAAFLDTGLTRWRTKPWGISSRHSIVQNHSWWSQPWTIIHMEQKCQFNKGWNVNLIRVEMLHFMGKMSLKFGQKC